MAKTVKDVAVAVELDAQQAADLGALEAMASQGQAQQDQAAPETESVPGLSAEESLAGLLGLAAMLGGAAGYKRAAAVWSGDRCAAVAGRAVPVLRRYAWGSKVLNFLETGAWVEELALVAVALPAVMATIKAAREDVEAMKPKREEQAPKNDDATNV